MSFGYNQNFQPAYVVRVTDGHDSAERYAPETVNRAGKNYRQAGVFDPHEVARNWPEQWAVFLQTAYRGQSQSERIQMEYGVSEKTVRNWLNAAGGCCGAQHVNIAMQRKRDLALAILFPAD